MENAFRPEKYRWIIIITYCYISAVSYGQCLQYGIISNIIQKYYNVSSVLVDLTVLIFQIVDIVAFIPCNFLIEKYSLRTIVLTSVCLTTLANLLKFLSISEDAFHVYLIAQSIAAVAQVPIMNIPSKVASLWFPADEVSTACAMGVLGSELGPALVSIVAPSVVRNHKNKENIGDDLFHYMIMNGVASVVMLVLTFFTFRAKPKLPPSQSQCNLVDQTNNTGSFFESLKVCLRNKDFLVLLFVFALSNGIWFSFGTLFNKIYLNYFANSEQDAGIIMLITIISGGCIGSVVFGYILDRTHRFKLVSFLMLLLSGALFSAIIFVFEMKIKIATFIICPIYGFFLISSLAVGYEYVLEVTYPVPENISCSLLTAVLNVFFILLTYTFELLFDNVGFLQTEIVIPVILFICSFSVFFVSPNLHRKKANEINT